jgi:hypothetical protein
VHYRARIGWKDSLMGASSGLRLLFFLFATTSLSGQSGSTSFNVNNETK